MRSTETFGAVFKACCQLASTDFSEGSIFQHGDDDPKEEIQPCFMIHWFMFLAHSFLD